jgi:hypothetical protein
MNDRELEHRLVVENFRLADELVQANEKIGRLKDALVHANADIAKLRAEAGEPGYRFYTVDEILERVAPTWTYTKT